MVLIHASAAEMKGIEGDYFNEVQVGHLYCGRTPLEELHKYHALRNQYSAIIGSVCFVDCVINHKSIWAEKTPRYLCGLNTKLFEKMEGIKPIYNWVVADPILFDKPILNVKGKLGFWDYDLPEEYETILKL